MNVIKAYFTLNMKLLFQDKLTFVWSIILPSVFLIANKSNITSVLDLRYFWVYIIFNHYVFGVGIHSLKQKEFGTLKTFFSIKPAKWEFFIANIFTQFVFIIFSLVIFNSIASIFLKFNYLEINLKSFLLMILMIPIAFLFFGVTLFKNVHANTLSTILTILISVSLIMMGMNTNLNIFNPLLYTSNILTMQTLNQKIIYLIISIICIGIGYCSVKKYSVLSNEVR